MAACSRPAYAVPVEQPASLEARMVTSVEGRDTARTLHVQAMLTNTGRAPVTVHYGQCALTLQVFRAPERAGLPIWSGAPFAVCLTYGASVTIAPGQTVTRPEFGRVIRATDILGDSLNNGHYYFTGRLSFDHTHLDAPAGDAELALSRRPPLDSVARFGGGTVHAHSVAVSSDGVVKARAEYVTRAGSGVLIRIERCSLVLRAYRDEQRRDTAPRSGPPDWMQQSECGSGFDQVPLDAGAVARFETTARASDILGDSLPAGRYYFAVEARVRTPGRSRAFLAAGDAVLQRP